MILCALCFTALIPEVLAVPVAYVDEAADFMITTDQGTPSVLDAGDVVTWEPEVGAPVAGLVFGTSAFTSIQAAIDAADNNGTVRIAAGTYDAGSEVAVVSKSLTIEGDGQALTILSGGGDGNPATANPSAHRVLSLINGTFTLKNLTIADGEDPGGGGGGGIYTLFANLVIRNCTISGGATPEHGGGIWCLTSSVELIECTVEGNSAGLDGGGLAIESTALILRRCLFNGNSAGRFGGGLSQDASVSSTSVIHNTTFTGNFASNQGGGAFLSSYSSSSVNMKFNTFTGNTAGVSAGGLWTSNASFEETYTLIAGNSAPLDPEGYFPRLLKAITSLEQAGVESISELLEPLADNGGPTRTHKLVYGSNAVDAHDFFSTVGIPLTDQRGFSRFYGVKPLHRKAADYGAYELHEIGFKSVPRNGTTNAPINTPITLTFNGAFSFSNLSQIVLRRGSDNAVVPITTSVSGATLTLTPVGLLARGETYHVEVNAPIATNDLNEVYGPVSGSALSFQTYTSELVYVDAAADFTPNGPHVTFKAGTSWQVTGLTLGSSAFTDLQSALDRVSPGGTVYIGDGTYDNGAELLLRSDVNLNGLGIGQTILSGGDTHRILRIQPNKNVVISDLTLTSGNATMASIIGTGNGGAIHGFGSAATLVLNRVHVTESRAAMSGGGIWYQQGTLAIEDSQISSNETDSTDPRYGMGGGLFLDRVASASIAGSTVTANAGSGNGGGIAAEGGSVTLVDSTVSGNTTQRAGAGIASKTNSQLSLTRCKIVGNVASGIQGGGGIDVADDSQVTISASTLSANQSSAYFQGNFAYSPANGGGAMCVSGFSEGFIYNSTIFGNSAPSGYGGGLYGGAGDIWLYNSTVVGNSAGLGAGVAIASAQLVDPLGNYGSEVTAKLISNHSLVAGNISLISPDLRADGTGTQSIFQGRSFIGNLSDSSVDMNEYASNIITYTAGQSISDLLVTNAGVPLLADNGGPTHTVALVAGSPAIDAGINASIPSGITADQRGVPRIFGGTVDIGAFEYLPTPELLSSNPVADAVAVNPATGITLIFNQDMFLGTGAIYLRRDDTNAIVPVTVSISGSTVTISPTGSLAGGVRYFIEIEPDALVNAAGTAFAGIDDPNTLGFTTGYSAVYVDAAGDFSPANPSAGASVIWKPGTPDQVSGLIFGSNAVSSLQSAEEQVCVNGTIFIAAGTYQFGATVGIQKSLILQGDGATSTQLSGGSDGDATVETGEYRVIGITGATTVVSMNDIGIINGMVSDFGGGIHLASGGSLTLNRCGLSGNRANVNGGAIYQASTSSLSIHDTTLSTNTAGSTGGGILNDGGTLVVHHSTLSGNTALATKTSSKGGGGIALLAGDATIINSTVSGNSTFCEGGGILDASSGTIEIAMSTITGNSSAYGAQAGTGGGGIWTNGALTLTHALVAGNSASGGPSADISGVFSGTGVNFIGTLSGSMPSGSGTNLTFASTPANTIADLIGPLSSNGGPTLTHALVAGCPAVNAGNNASISGNPLFDQRGAGFVRISGGTIDIGAYELLQPTPLLDWRILHGLDPAGADDLANPSGDGVANLLKYAFNMAPQPGDLLTANRRVLEAGGTYGLPRIETLPGPLLSITYVRRIATSSPGINYQALSGVDLENMNPLNPALETITSINSEWERVTIVDPVSTNARFGKVKVTE